MTAPLKARGPGSQSARTAAAEDPRGLPARRTVIEAEYVRLILAAAERRGCRVDAILERARIDDLVVVDADDRPIGLVDTQDLTRLKLV